MIFGGCCLGVGGGVQRVVRGVMVVATVVVVGLQVGMTTAIHLHLQAVAVAEVTMAVGAHQDTG